ncbi:MAG: hypothetical protein WDO56_16720 [Gammaproteobacteria bacterium]
MARKSKSGMLRFKRSPTPAAAAKRLRKSLRRLAKDSISVISGSLARKRVVRRAKKK